MFIWLASIADSIVNTIISFFAIILMLWTFTMAGVLQDENGRVKYCETSDTGVESCYMREWSIVD